VLVVAQDSGKIANESVKIVDFPFMPVFAAALTHLFDVLEMGISFSLGVKIFHTLHKYDNGMITWQS